MFMFKKPKAEELADLPLTRSGRKEGLALIKGVKKFLRYNEDLISEDKKAEIAQKQREFAKNRSATTNPRLGRRTSK
jgi:hypothetical protein